MLTVEEILAAPAMLAERIETERLTTRNDVLSPEEQTASDEARVQVQEALEDIIANLDKAIVAKEDAAATLFELDVDAESAFDITPPKGKDFSRTLDGGVDEQQQTLQSLALSIEPVIAKFDETLRLRTLKNYSAVLTSVPIVGLKGKNIMYSRATPTKPGTIQDIWCEFGPLPSGADISSATATHFFPFQGDLCMSVGQSVWRIEHRTNDDPEISKAFNDWPKIFKSQWTKIGDKCLPDANARSVIPYSVFSADRKQIKFQLLVLTANNEIMLLQDDDIKATNTWKKMSNAQSGTDSDIQWKKIAYWNDRIVALDSNNNTWTMKPDFSKSTYDLSDKFQVQAFSEMTATNVGPVGVGPDGYLYRRIVEISPAAAKEDEMKLRWEKYLKQDGVKSLGCASPGVMLDLHLLTSALRTRYINTQSELYPIVNKLNAFSITHEIFLKQLLDPAKDYQDVGDSERKQAIALRQGKRIAKHAMIWAKIMNSAVGKAKESVNLMTEEVRDFKSQIDIKIVELKQKFEVLKSQLAASGDQKLSAAFWGAIAANITGLGIAIVSALTGVETLATLADGPLFVEGLVNACISGSKMSDLQASITKVKQEMADVSTAITQIGDIQQIYQNIGGLYDKLSLFWGTFYDMTSPVKNMDDATLMKIGAGSLEDASSIEASIYVSQKMSKAAEAYLAVLKKQGIGLKEDEDDEARAEASFDVGDSAQQDSTTSKNSDVLIKNAREALSGGDFEKYEESLVAESSLDLPPGFDRMFLPILQSPWFSITTVHNNIAMFNGGFDRSVDVPEARAINQKLAEAKSSVLRMLDQISALTSVAGEWTSKIPDFPEARRQIVEVEQYQKKAIKICLEAQNTTTHANNVFRSISSSAITVQRELELMINQLRNQIQAIQRAKDEDWNSFKRSGANIFVPNDVLWPQHQARWLPRVQSEERLIQAYMIAVNTADTFSSQSRTWQKMCEVVHGNLGFLYNTLTAIRLDIREDAGLYRQLLNGQWQNLRNNVNEVRRSLGGNQPQPEAEFSDLEAESSFPGTTVTSDDDSLVRALRPASNMESLLLSQALDATDLVNKFEYLKRFKEMDDILASKQTKGSTQLTLGQSLLGLRLSYSSMMSYEYDVVQQVSTLAILQPIRLRKLANRRNKVSAILKSTEISLQLACKAANEARREYTVGITQFVAALTNSKEVASDIRGRLNVFRKDLAERDKDYKDRVVEMIVYVAVNGFAGGATVASVIYGAIAAPAAAGSAAIPGLVGLISIVSDDEDNSVDGLSNEDKAKKVQEGIREAQGAWAKFVHIRERVKDDTKTPELGRVIFGDVSLEALAIIVATLQSAVKSSEAAIQGLEALQEPLVRLRQSVDGIFIAMQTMQTSIQGVLSSRDVDEQTLPSDEVDVMAKLWEKVGAASERWLDTINDHGLKLAALR